MRLSGTTARLACSAASSHLSLGSLSSMVHQARHHSVPVHSLAHRHMCGIKPRHIH
jgi:hypothetical protein